jgi:outer membrane immunogenic protein
MRLLGASPSVKKIVGLLLGTAGCCVATAAIAADMGLPPPAPQFAAPPIWTGFYVGGNVGGAWDPTGGNNTNCAALGDCTTAHTTITGVAGGLQAGYNYQIGVIVIGAEGTFSGSSLRGSYLAADGINTLTTSVDYFGTVTGKFGVTFGSLLLYGKGGAAWTHTKQSDFNAAESLTFTTNYWQSGWTVGGGAEYAFSPNWSVRVEYALINTPNQPTTFSNAPTGVSFTALMHQQINQITAGVDYRF